MTMLASAVVLFAAAVLATQYAGAGGREWGWRYFSLALPVAVPIALIVIVDGAARISERDRRVAGQMLVGLCAAIGVLAFLSLRAVRDDDRQIVDGIRAAYQATPAGDGGKPVVVTTQPGTLDRFSWDHVDETRWLAIETDDRPDVAAFLARIERLGVQRITFVTAHLDDDLEVVMRNGDVVARRALPDEHWVLTVVLRAEGT
jgi:hypothetical protein